MQSAFRGPVGRPTRRTLTAGLALGVLLGVAGCGTAPRLQPARTPAGTPPPAALATLETNATAMMDSAVAKDWTAVSAELTAIHQAWAALRPALASRGARSGLLDSTASAIRQLSYQSNRLSGRGTARAANRVTAFFPDLQVLYTSPVPPQLTEMEFLARAIRLHANSRNWGAVWDDARTLGTQWAYIRPKAQRVGVANAAQLDLQIAELDAAVHSASGGHRVGAALPAVVPMTVGQGGQGGITPGSDTAAGVAVAPHLTARSSSGNAAGGSLLTPSATLPTSPSASGAGSASGSSTPAAFSAATSATTPGSSTAPARPGARTRSGPASSPPTAGAVQTAATAVLATLGALQQDFQSGTS